MSHNTTAARNSGGRAASAAATSWSRSASASCSDGVGHALANRSAAPSASPSKRIFCLRRAPSTNLFLDGARRRQKIRFDGLADGAADRLASAWPTPSEQLADADLDHDVAAALAALPPEFRAAVVLCDIEGLSYEEIASVLDVKIGTVRSRIHRGRAQLRAALAHRQPTGERERYLGVAAETGRSMEPARPG